jgi:glycosyltransferase involved in cell wall biosynthesis
LKKPLILSEHIDPEFPRKIGKFTVEERVRIFSGADRIHLISEAFVKTLPEFLSGRISVINNTVRDAAKLATPAVVAEDGFFHLLCVARLVPRKNVEVLLSAFASIAEKFPGWCLDLIGYGDLQSQLELQVEKANIGKQVNFLGRIEDPYPFYERAHLFVLPSLTEGFPLTSLEAMAHGLPVVGFADCVGLNEQVLSGRSGLLVDRDDQVKSLSAGLAALMMNDQARSEMGSYARERFSELYSQKKIFDEWESMITDVACGDKPLVLESMPSDDVCALAGLRSMLEMGPEKYLKK